jgi:hypothetical protein
VSHVLTLTSPDGEFAFADPASLDGLPAEDLAEEAAVIRFSQGAGQYILFASLSEQEGWGRPLIDTIELRPHGPAKEGRWREVASVGVDSGAIVALAVAPTKRRLQGIGVLSTEALYGQLLEEEPTLVALDDDGIGAAFISGYGDGLYKLEVVGSKLKADAVRIRFL